MAERSKIIEALTEYKDVVTSILIDDFGYSIAEVKAVTEETLDTNTVAVAYNIGIKSDEVIAVTHYITLQELTGADTVIFASERPFLIVN